MGPAGSRLWGEKPVPRPGSFPRVPTDALAAPRLVLTRLCSGVGFWQDLPVLYTRPLIVAVIWIIVGMFFLIAGPWEVGVALFVAATVPLWQEKKNRATGTTWSQRRVAGRLLRGVLAMPLELTFDEAGIHYSHDGGTARSIVWDELVKIDVCSCRLHFRWELLLIFTSSDDRTPGFRYEDTPFDMLQEMQRLPDFDIDEFMAPIDKISGNLSVTLWERPSTKHKQRSASSGD